MSKQLLETEQVIQELLVQLQDLKSATSSIAQAKKLVDQSTLLANESVAESQVRLREAISLTTKSVEASQAAVDTSTRLFESVTRQSALISTFATSTESQMVDMKEHMLSLAGQVSRSADSAQQAMRFGKRNSVLVGVALLLQILLVGLYIWIYQAWLIQGL